MNWSLWTLFVMTEAALSAAPGPAVLFVVSRGLEGRNHGALWSAGGILCANALYFALSATSLGALLAASEVLFSLVRWAGAAYLLYLGGSALLVPARSGLTPRTGEARIASARGSFLRAVALQLSNPKALLFFLAVLPQFVDRSGPIPLQLLILGITSICLEFVILATYGLGAARAGRVLMRPRLATVTGRLSGLLLVGAALALVRLDR